MARKRDQGLAARLQRAFDDEADVPGDGIGQFVLILELPPFDFGHRDIAFLYFHRTDIGAPGAAIKRRVRLALNRRS